MTPAAPAVATPTADLTDENLDDISNLDPDDNVSIISEDSDDFQMPNNYQRNNNNNNVQNNVNNPARRGNRELNSLGSVPQMPRLRSGRSGRQ